VLSFIGQPLVRFFDRLHIRKLKHSTHHQHTNGLIDYSLCFSGHHAIFVPLIVNQAETIAKIDVDLWGRKTWKDLYIGSMIRCIHLVYSLPEENHTEFFYYQGKIFGESRQYEHCTGQRYKCGRNIFIGCFDIFYCFLFHKR